MSLGDILEPIFVSSAIFSYCIYHIYFVHRYRTNPLSTIIGVNHAAKRLWAEVVMSGGQPNVGIQTVRNSMMSSQLLASTSLTLTALVAAYLVKISPSDTAIDMSIWTSSYIHPVHKFFAVILSFSVSFYCYMQSVRAANHAGYLLAFPANGDHPFKPGYVARVLERCAYFHTAGTRVFYMAFLFIIWIFGPIPMFVMTILLIANLAYLDRADPGMFSSHFIK